MNNEKYKSTIGFTDLLFNILVGFAFLFIIAFLLIKPEAKKEDFERKAEFIVIMEWDHDAADDIDLYVQDPAGGRVSFRHPRIHLMHLDKDDLGTTNDTIVINGIPTIVRINREVVTIRGITKGEYIVNAHYFAERIIEGNGPESGDDDEIISVDRYGVGSKKRLRMLTVKIEIHKVNPYSIVWVGEKKFHRRGQEETFVRFRLNKEGGVIKPFTYQEKLFIAPPSVSSNRNTDGPVPSYSQVVETQPYTGSPSGDRGSEIVVEEIPDLGGPADPERPHYDPLPSSSYNPDADELNRYDGAEH